MRRIRKWRRNCREKGHTCSRLKETGRDAGISPALVGEREARYGEGGIAFKRVKRLERGVKIRV